MDEEIKNHRSYSETQKKVLIEYHAQYLWAYWIVVLLGFWMFISPLTFDYAIGAVNPGGGRSVWLSLENRVQAGRISDIISGFLLIFFGLRSLQPNRPYSIWICCLLGIWISFSPLLFWAPNAFVYLNDTMVGALAIAFTVLIPGIPNSKVFLKQGPEVPAGWSFNPSSWPRRWILILLSFFAWMTSRYLSAYQLGYTDFAWDPFFGNSTVKVLTSKISKSLPVSDAGLGAMAYTFEFLMGFLGSTNRWRTMPWMVALFGVLVVPLGFISICLVILQPLAVGAWCTFCLLTAAIMLPMIPLEIDEVFAMIQHLKEQRTKGSSFWKVFFKGGESDIENKDERTPELIDFPKHPLKIFMASFWGVSFPLNLLLSTAIGLWLMFAPHTFNVSIDTAAADLNHLIGALIIVFSVIAMSEVLRAGRYINIILGIILASATFFLNGGNAALSINDAVFGVLAAILAFPRGEIKEKYGIWDKYIK